MSKHVFILSIPGIGTKQAGYSKGMVKDLKRFARNTSLEDNFTVVECRPFNETNLDSLQEQMYERLDADNRLGGILSLRKAVFGAFGDAVLIDHKSQDLNSPYRIVQRLIKEKVEEINQAMHAYDDAVLVIQAASMGVHLLSCYIWDADNGKGIFDGAPANANNNLRNVRYLATFGCNIPLYVSGIAENEIVAVDKRNGSFEWDNYYDKDDVLGWPLKQLSPTYSALVADHQINTGPYIGSHVRYWDDNSFTKPFTKKLVQLIDEL